MASQTAAPSGIATPQTLAHYRRLAEAGAGITFVEYTYVHPSGRSEANQLGLTSAAHAAALAPVADAIRAAGSIPGIQLTHGGGKTDRDLTGGPLMGPSRIPVPMKGEQLDPPDPMRADEIALWCAAFTAAATFAVQAGFALIELHAAHGYGLNQWLSPLTNSRLDDYGGDTLKRRRLLLEIVQALRRQHPEILLTVRLAGRDFLPGGLTADDSLEISQSLVAAGVDLLDISSGLGGWRRPTDRQGEGYLVPEAEHIQRNVRVPVIGVGGFKTAVAIDDALRRQRLSLAAVGRAILADPASWRAENLTIHSRPIGCCRQTPSLKSETFTRE